MVSKTCPTSLQDASQEDIIMDQAHDSARHFVYPRRRGEAPLCRLEMKFPRQKEAFYLRQLLLRFPKRSFRECYVHNSKRYRSIEEALLASGCLARAQEAHDVMDELLALKYTGAQLRFAFLVLLEQDADPHSLYRKYEQHLMKDLLDKGLSPATAAKDMQKLLRAAWLENGNSENESSWLIASERPLSASAPPDATAIHSHVSRDPAQTAAAAYILEKLNNCTGEYVFAQGRSGTYFGLALKEAYA